MSKEMTDAEWAADQEVQLVYKILCDTKEPPGDRHWEGWKAERIVLALRQIRKSTSVISE